MWGKRPHKLDREERLAASAARLMASATPRASVAAKPEFREAIHKDNPQRSEEYRRLVAALPCANCGIFGYSQHAHENDGKGKGLKVDDRRGMPLCCARPGVEGCHVAFDQYRLFAGKQAHIDQGRAWVAQTQQTILDSGKWPKNLRKPDER